MKRLIDFSGSIWREGKRPDKYPRSVSERQREREGNVSTQKANLIPYSLTYYPSINYWA